MSKGSEIRCYDYVNHPYEQVRDAVKRDALTVFQSATKAAASRAQSIAAELHIDVGGIGVKTDIRISVKDVDEKILDAVSTPAERWSTKRFGKKCMPLALDSSDRTEHRTKLRWLLLHLPYQESTGPVTALSGSARGSCVFERAEKCFARVENGRLISCPFIMR